MLILHYNYFNVWYRNNATHTVIEQSNAATNPYFVNTSFPTGTKVSRGVPDFNDISYSELYVKNNILTLYARSSIII